MTFADGARRVAGALVAACIATTAAPAFAEPTAQDLASARELYKEGRALREQGDVQKALEKLRAAHALGQTPVTGLELARTYVLVGKLVDAHEVSIGVARLPVASDETEKSSAARTAAAELAAELEPRLAKLTVTVTGLAPGATATVRVDGERVPPESLGEPRSVDPGSHVVTLSIPGAGEAQTKAELKEGESRAVAMQAPAVAAPVTTSPPASVPEAPPPAAAEEPVHVAPHHSNVVVVTGLTVAGMGALFGITFGVAALNGKNNLQSECPGGGCGPSHYSDLSTAQLEGNVATVAFIVAGAGAGAAILDLLLRPSAPQASASLRPDVGPGWVGAHGSF